MSYGETVGEIDPITLNHLAMAREGQASASASAQLAGEIDDQLLSRPDSEGSPHLQDAESPRQRREQYSAGRIQILGSTATGPRRLSKSSRTLDSDWWNTPLPDGTPRWQAAIV
jgi:hypothetical protein